MSDTALDKEQPAPPGKANRAAILGAMFLMATSAIGPGFITQTTTFTAKLGAAFAFAVLASTLVDVAVQLNVWRVVGISGMRVGELGNSVLPGLGWALAGLVVLGGLVFNIGNIGGAGLGTSAMLGMDVKLGGGLSAGLAIAIFLSKKAGVALDRIVVVLGAGMILLTGYVAIVSKPPVMDALRETVAPSTIDLVVITTLIGGTVGGYITYAGAHRALDSGLSGPENARDISRSSVIGILVTAVMRALLFLAVLGVVAGGVALAKDNPAASAFEAAAGEVGLRTFGIILWAASLTSVIGAAYTSVTFLTRRDSPEKLRNLLTVGFIGICTVIFLIIGSAPVKLLIFAGAFNGLILPVGFTLVLWVAWRRRDLLQGYKYPQWLLVIGVVAWLITLYLGYSSITSLGKLL